MTQRRHNDQADKMPAASGAHIVQVDNLAHTDHVVTLFREYWNSFGFTPCFQGFDNECANLPGKYARPNGRLGLAMTGDMPAGCIALRPIDRERCEAKRLYVRPQFRGQRIGLALLEWLMAEARASGYRHILCDTLPVMGQALKMYERAGFRHTGPYVANPTPGAIYLRFDL
jgi:putative acetyltransferase